MTRRIYRVTRSVAMSIVIAAVALYALIYMALSIPAIQNIIRDRASVELSRFMKSRVEIGSLQIVPFNTLVVNDLTVYDLNGKKAIVIDRLSAGINLWKLISGDGIVITHAELLGGRFKVYQLKEGQPLNIQFIIDAFASKDKTKPPTRLRLQLRHIILRQCSADYDKCWIPVTAPEKFDINHIRITSLGADASIPIIITGHGPNEDRVVVNMKRLTLAASPGIQINRIRAKCNITPNELTIDEITLQMRGTSLTFSPVSIHCSNPYRYEEALENTDGLVINLNSGQTDNFITLSDFKAFWNPLSIFKEKNHITHLGIRVSRNKGTVTLNLPSTTDLPGITGTLATEKDDEKQVFAVDFKGSLNIQGPCAKKWITALNIHHPALKGIDAIDYVGTGDNEIEFSSIFVRKQIQTGYLSVPLLTVAGRMGQMNLSAKITKKGATSTLKGTVETGKFNIGALELPGIPAGITSFSGLAAVDGEITGNRLNYLTADVALDYLQLRTLRLAGISANADIRNLGDIYALDGEIESEDPEARLQASVEASVSTDYKVSEIRLDADVQNFNLSMLNKKGAVEGSVTASLRDITTAGVNGSIELDNVSWHLPSGKTLAANRIMLSTSQTDGYRTTSVQSPWVEGSINGCYSFMNLPQLIRFNDILFSAERSNGDTDITHQPSVSPDYPTSLNFTIPTDFNELLTFFGVPINLVTPASITGGFDIEHRSLNALINLPYLSQNKKLIRNTRLEVSSSPDTGVILTATTTMPAKASDVTLNVTAGALRGAGNADIRWRFDRKESFEGLLSMEADYTPNNVNCIFKRSEFTVNDTVWVIEPASITYADKRLAVNGVNVWSGTQKLTMDGSASASPNDTVKLVLADMDLDYIFSTLGINYVTFGGRATGDFYAADLFTKAPVLYTPRLNVRGLTYNSGYLGDADIHSWWIPDQKKVSIVADIQDQERHVATIDGGIWTGRDSLSFDLDANKVNIKFLQPFMQAFTSDVNGRASGQACLYGTFKDINLRGHLYADTITLKLDFTNTTYGGSDSVIIDPGIIHINNFTLRDKYGNSALLNGFVGHNYFHEPRFRFAITNARNLLCYDTDASINPVWYGRVFGSGSATIEGEPGIVNILVDMQTAPKSVFTFALTDQLEAEEYNFLTFTDKRKAAAIAALPSPADTVPEAVRRFQKSAQSQHQNGRDEFRLDLRATVTPQAELVLIMDPVAGDKIRAFGSGALQLGYTTPGEELTMYGKYTLERGSYNFSLQDLILKTFTIRPGSFISFNGDPYAANLDITAAYRVNTNLTDLDKSFSQDRDLNRTNVPVEAVLHVDGDMRHPEVTFDIDLPTLNADALRKVKSIISTDDMMSRQIVYLLALHRFYTPEYMGGSNSGGELASIASSTLSANLSNILGQLSPNWSISPNIRSDKGDFSDTEVDLALSSQLFNNRLLLNGNLGYRDRATSSTTFIGDFDLEYLLNRQGSFRLKAYNHFNDQNYYLKSALTTQGIGIIYKHDFNTWFKFLRPKKRKKKEPSESK